MNRTTSLYLDIVRPAAAIVVLLSHVAYHSLSGGQLRFLGSAGVQAVDVFFVLSGFVIAHVCATREHDLRSYAFSRAVRIYSVVIPALLVTAIVDFIGTRVSPETYLAPYQPLTAGLIARSVLFLGEQWNAHRFPGSNGPYWSLGFEVWYYVAFGAFVFSSPRWRWLATSGVLLFIGPKVAILFPVWLMGVASYRFCSRHTVPPAVGWSLLLLPIILFIGYQHVRASPSQPFMPVTLDPSRLASAGQDYLIGALFCLHLIGFVSVGAVFSAWLERLARCIRWIAGATFSLYLMHLPIMFLLSSLSPWPKESVGTLLLLVLATPAACLGFAEVSERRKVTWRRLFVAMRVFPRVWAERRQG